MPEENRAEEVLEPVRPTKKQQELLEYLDTFIQEHGYGPSYREIMVGCNYSSVATVAVHVQNLISRGHVKKNGRSARSLEIIGRPVKLPALKTNAVEPNEEKWFIDKVEYYFVQTEEQTAVSEIDVLKLQTLLDAMNIFGLEGAASAYQARMSALKARLGSS